MRDTDVRDAVESLATHCHAVRLSHNDTARFNTLDSELGAPTASTVSAASDLYPAKSVDALVAAAFEGVVLLEAVAMSRRLSLLIVEAKGVPEVVRCIATVGHLKTQPATATPTPGAAASAFGSVASSALAAAKAAAKPLPSALITPGVAASKRLKAAISAVTATAKKDVTAGADEDGVVRDGSAPIACYGSCAIPL